MPWPRLIVDRTSFIAIAALVALVTAMWLPLVPPAQADDDKDRHALQMERKYSLVDAVEMIHKRFEGKVLEAKLKYDDDLHIPIYKAKVLQPQGSIMKLEIDANTLEVLKMKGEDHDDDFWGKSKDRFSNFWNDWWK